MSLPEGNPIVKLWREVRNSKLSLDEARARAGDPSFASSLSSSDINELVREHAVFHGDMADETTGLAVLLVDAARAATHIFPMDRWRPTLGACPSNAKP